MGSSYEDNIRFGYNMLPTTFGFYFFSQFCFGIVMLFAGFSYSGNDFCQQKVDNKSISDQYNLLGPQGSIVLWNKFLGLALISQGIVLTFLCTILQLFEHFIQPPLSDSANIGNFSNPIVIAMFVILTIIQLVFASLGINTVFSNIVPIQCIQNQMGNNFPYITMLIYSWVSVISFISVGLGILIVVGMSVITR